MVDKQIRLVACGEGYTTAVTRDNEVKLKECGSIYMRKKLVSDIYLVLHQSFILHLFHPRLDVKVYWWGRREGCEVHMN